MNLNHLKYRLANMMRGRYGPDALYRFLMSSMIVFLIINLIFPSVVFYLLSLFFGVFALYRVMSRQHAPRAKENQSYLALRSKIQQGFLQTINRFKDRKTHRYINCPACRQSLRLKRKQGLNHIKCPMCGNEFDINMR
ncbi:MAG: hypothetical protein GXZ04_04625 [Clostridiales bacterium]|nr:hypothetical protein [Clostridiales bacterium]